MCIIVVLGLFIQGDCTLVVIKDLQRLFDAWYSSKITDVLQACNLICNFTSHNVSRLACRVYHRLLFGTFPCNNSSIKKEHPSRLWARVVFISQETCISVTCSSQFFFSTIYQKHILTYFQILEDILYDHLMTITMIILISTHHAKSIWYIGSSTYHVIHDRSYNISIWDWLILSSSCSVMDD